MYYCQKKLLTPIAQPSILCTEVHQNTNIDMYALVCGFPNPRAVAIFVSMLRVINEGAIRSDDHLSTFSILGH